ncbi:MAG: 50S ribosomal protein L9 [Candidatus Omnitrophota bacterium]
MEVILKEDIEKLGKSGDVVAVKVGYARNFLLPKGLAVPATPRAKVQLEIEKKKNAKMLQLEKKDAQELADRLLSVSCTITKKVGQDEHIFGSVTAADVTEALSKEGIQVDKKKVVLDEPLKSLGIYQVMIKLHPDVTASVKVWVVKE